MNKIAATAKGVIIFLFGISFQSCAQQKIESREEYFSVNDSVLLRNYLKKSGEHPLFSVKHGLFIDSALQIAPQNSYLWQQRGMLLFKQKKYELGMPYLDSAVKYDKINHYLEYRAFMKCIFQKSYAASIIDFREAKLKNPQGGIMDHRYDFYLGLCYLQLNKFDSAELSFNECIKAERQKFGDSWVHFMDWFYLGIVLFEKEDYKKAVSSLDSCLRTYTNFSDAKYYKAMCLNYLGKHNEALQLAIQAKKDLADGYTINEDNAIYETYPYQIRKIYLEGYIKMLQAEKEKIK